AAQDRGARGVGGVRREERRSGGGGRGGWAELPAPAGLRRACCSSAADLEPVFQAMLEKAIRICEASIGVLYLYNGMMFRAFAWIGAPPKLIEFNKQRGLFEPPAGTPLDRLLLTKKTNYTADDSAEPNPGAPPGLAAHDL